MASKRKKKGRQVPSQNRRTARLELIKRRHRELILDPREIIAADLELEGDFDGGLGQSVVAGHFRLEEALEIGRM